MNWFPRMLLLWGVWGDLVENTLLNTSMFCVYPKSRVDLIQVGQYQD